MAAAGSTGDPHLGAVVGGGLHSDHDLVLQRMRDFVAGKQNLRVLHQLAVATNRQKEHFHFKATGHSRIFPKAAAFMNEPFLSISRAIFHL